MMKKIIAEIKGNKAFFIILGVIMALGIFARTYNFHNWLLFGDDQVRDAYVASDVITGKSAWPMMGPFMSYSGAGDHSEKNSFHLGPIYYYFQIISAKIFGNYPDRFAYPDVFFSILSIPLFYLFLRIYFGRNLSLGIAGIYSISAYFISYSRFAWNTNLIPFFVLLFLLSLYKFLEKNEKTSWLWVVSLGFALGVGFQLHVITMLLFSAVTFLFFLVSMKKNYQAWKKWAIVCIIFLALNASQIVDGTRTNFSNTKTLLNFVFLDDSASTSVRPSMFTLSKLSSDIDCHIEANFFLLSSYGKGRCSHDLISVPSDGWVNHYFKDIKGNLSFIILLASFLFSIVGYFFLIYYAKKEDNLAKKYFLRLVIVYFIVGFLIMLPLSKNSINDLRYFVFGFFMPFLFLGFLIKFISQKITQPKYAAGAAVIIFGLLIVSNAEALSADAKPFFTSDVTCSSLYETTLGELEPVVQYMISHANEQKQIYLEKNDSHRVMPDSLIYLLKQKGISLMKLEDIDYPISGDSPVFNVSCKKPKLLPENTLSKIGRIYVSQSKGSSISK